jgi:hypothetical protein
MLHLEMVCSVAVNRSNAAHAWTNATMTRGGATESRPHIAVPLPGFVHWESFGAHSVASDLARRNRAQG